MRFLYGQGHALPNAHDHLIECGKSQGHCLKIGEWPLAFNGNSYGVGTAKRLQVLLAGRQHCRQITGVMNWP